MIAFYAAVLLLNIGLAYFFGKQLQHKGYPFQLGFFLCIFGSPLVALILVLWLPDRETKPKINPQLLLEIELEKARMELGDRNANA
jgi:hypothetical protein